MAVTHPHPGVLQKRLQAADSVGDDFLIVDKEAANNCKQIA
jgi:hypothetical protein